MKRLWIIPVVLLLAVGGYFGWQYYQNQQKAAEAASLQTAKVEIGDVSTVVDATGSVRTKQTAQMTWQTTGEVGAVNVKVGQKVKANDVLATMNTTSLPANVILAQGDLISAQKALDDLLNSTTPQAQAELGMVKAQKTYTDTANREQNLQNFTDSSGFRDAQANYDAYQAEVVQLQQALEEMDAKDPRRAEIIMKLRIARYKRDQAKAIMDLYGGEPSTNELETASANTSVALAQLEDAQRKWDSLKDGPSQQDIQAAKVRIQAAQATLGMSQLTAPFDGIITDVNLQAGDQVKPGLVAFQIDDMSTLYIDLQVSEVDINRVKVGQPVNLTFDAVLNKNYTGKVSEIGIVGTTVQGAVFFKVTVQVTESDSQVKPGMTVSASIITEEKKGVLTVPNQAISTVNGQSVVNVVRNGQTIPVTIELGLISDQVTEVMSGDLKAGDDVVLNATQQRQRFPMFGGPGGGQ